MIICSWGGASGRALGEGGVVSVHRTPCVHHVARVVLGLCLAGFLAMPLCRMPKIAVHGANELFGWSGYWENPETNGEKQRTAQK